MRIMTKGAIASSRSTGGAFDPTDISGCELWFDADDVSSITKDVDDDVSQWNDKSGNARHVSQDTDSKQPSYNSTDLNSKGGITFDGVDDELDTASANTIAQNFTVVYVGCWETAGAFDTLFGSIGTAGAFHYCWSDGHNEINAGANVETGHVSAGTNELRYIKFSGTNSQYRANGVASGQLSPGSNSLAAISLGHTHSTGNYGNVTINELVVYSKVLSAQELTDIEQYLYDKWGFSY